MQMLRTAVHCGLAFVAKATQDHRTTTRVDSILRTEARPRPGHHFQAWQQSLRVTNADQASVNLLEGTAIALEGFPDLQFFPGEDFSGRAFRPAVAIRAILIEDYAPQPTDTRLIGMAHLDGTLYIPRAGRVLLDAAEGDVLPDAYFNLTFVAVNAAQSAWVRITAITEYED
jgi:hypothetical protein